MRYHDLLREKIHHLHNEAGVPIRVYQNPDRSQFEALLMSAPDNQANAVLSGGRLYVWPAELGDHDAMITQLGLHKVQCIDLVLDRNAPHLSRKMSPDYRVRANEIIAQSRPIVALYGPTVGDGAQERPI